VDCQSLQIVVSGVHRTWLFAQFESGNRFRRFNDIGNGLAQHVGIVCFAFRSKAGLESVLGRIETRGICAESVEASIAGRQGIKEIGKYGKFNHIIVGKQMIAFYPF
jgi:hypothetical protein